MLPFYAPMCCFLADFPEISSYFPLDFIPLDSYEEILSDTLTLLQLQLDAKATYWAKKGFYPIWVTINDIPSLLLSLVD